MSKIDDELFEKRSGDSVNCGDCPKCGSTLKLKFKGKTTFIGCSNYPDCDYSESLHHDEINTLKVIDNSECPYCQNLLAVKNGRFGMFIGCTNFPSCHFIQHNKQPEIQEEHSVTCPQCKKGKLKKRQNKFGKFFYACDRYPKCKFLINQKPIQHTCKSCGYTVMVEADENGQLKCANKKCGKLFQCTNG